VLRVPTASAGRRQRRVDRSVEVVIAIVHLCDLDGFVTSMVKHVRDGGFVIDWGRRRALHYGHAEPFEPAVT